MLILLQDVCVPLSHLAELISRSKQELDASPLTCTVIAHAGDGNFHTIVLFDPTKKEQRREAERLNHFMVHTALSMEGFYAKINYQILSTKRLFEVTIHVKARSKDQVTLGHD
uniref:D-lactate dehydrogenase [cytochrome], mitochondrial-like isoform X2 n=1 Tax=Nicotiana tabacum TaxID=4097 RepID=A0A1S4CQU7_TOBAC|nr:PREDICTED: D-lactate dehydrogenase [cytochrome], mitochondrial-like isoform X2 [Nicotiana tabacum]